MYHRFTELADRKKGLRNEEILGLRSEVVEEAKQAEASGPIIVFHRDELKY